jgi:hypothetical protein
VAGVDRPIAALLADGSTLWLGGQFSVYAGHSANGIVKLDEATWSVDTTFSPPSNNGFPVAGTTPISAMAASGTSLYVGGPLNAYRGTPVHGLAKLDVVSGAIDTSFVTPSSASAGVQSLALGGPSLYVGHFYGVTKIDAASGALDAAFASPSGLVNVNALAVSGNSIFAGGWDNVAGDLAKLDLATGGLDPTFNPSGIRLFDDGAVEALAAFDTSLYVGGTFTTYRGVPSSARRIAKLDLATSVVDSTFHPPGASSGFDNDVSTLAVAGSSIYAGGRFSSYRGVASSANALAKLDRTSGSIDTAFGPPGPAANGFVGGALGTIDGAITYSLPANVFALGVSNGSLAVGGNFGVYRGSRPALFAAMIDSRTGNLN